MRAMVFAAGVGSRMGSLTEKKPKCLIEVGGIPLLRHVLSRLKSAGVSEVMINLHHHPEQIRDYLIEHRNFGLAIEFSHEDELLDTGGGLRHVRDYFDRESDFLIHNSDILSLTPLDDLLRTHRSSGGLATLCVQDRGSKRGLYVDQNNLLVGWTEATNGPPPGSRTLNFCGIHAVSPKVFCFMPSGGRFSIIKSYVEAAAGGERIHAWDIGDTLWADVGTPEKLTAAEEAWKCRNDLP